MIVDSIVYSQLFEMSVDDRSNTSISDCELHSVLSEYIENRLSLGAEECH